MPATVFDFVQRLGSKVAFAAPGTHHERQVLDNEQPPAFPVAARDSLDASSFPSTNITSHVISLLLDRRSGHSTPIGEPGQEKKCGVGEEG
jgi:hypothetical protein